MRSLPPESVDHSGRGQTTRGRNGSWRAIAAFAAACALWLAAPGAAPAQDAAQPRWEPLLYGTLEGKQALLYNGSLDQAKLTFGDLDGDGDVDLMLGKADGRVALFENQGSKALPRWRLSREAITAIHPAQEGEPGAGAAVREIATGAWAAPALVDIDGDGDLDLFVGAQDGRLMFFRNIGNAHLPSFALEAPQFISGRFGKAITPRFVDVNADRAPDLLIGNERGQVYLLLNQGNQKRARFCVEFPRADALSDEPPPCAPTPRAIAEVGPETHAAPELEDWDGDGDLDLFVGKSNGSIAYYDNAGTRFLPDWRLVQKRFLAIDSGGFAAPAFLDANRDGNRDLLVGNSTNRVYVFSRRERVNMLDIYQIDANYLNLVRFGTGLERLAAAAGDLDGDKDADLILGDKQGRLTWLENVGSAKAPAWRVHDNDLLPDAARFDAVPHLADLDGDGDLDLLVGTRDGRVTLIRNTGSAKAAAWQIESTGFAGIGVGGDAAPWAADVDKDGDLDLLVGNARGLVILYVNNGTAQKPDYALTATRFGEVSASGNAVPAWFDWNGDGEGDLVLGDRNGRLLISLNKSAGKEGLPRAWQPQTVHVDALRAEGFATPAFADLNGDGRPDLIAGDTRGNLRLLLNATLASAPVAGTPAPAAGAAPAAAPGAPAGAGLTAAPSAAEPQAASPFAALEDAAPAEQALLSMPDVPRGPVPPIFGEPDKTFGGWKFDGKAAPALADLDGDGDVDLVVGTASGKLIHFRNDGTKQEARWTQLSEAFAGYDGARYPSPAFGDVDGDGKTDLLVGTEDGTVRYYRGTGAAGDAAFARQADLVPAGSGGRNAAPTIVDLNGDKRADLLVGNFTGQLLAFMRTEKLGAVEFALANRRFLNLDVGVSSTPALGDLDADGTIDLLIGSDQGNLLYLKKIPNTVEKPDGWEKGSDYLKQVKFPPGTTPRMSDLNGDGAVDLVIGTDSGRIYFYRNEASLQGAGAAQ